MNKTEALNYIDLIIKDLRDRRGLGDETVYENTEKLETEE
jgi:hypothetical protein